MDPQLKSLLKQLGLLPLELDEEVQAYFRQIGLDPVNLETHYTPGTPTDLVEKMEAITQGALTLYHLEKSGWEDLAEYQTVQDQMRADIDYILMDRLGCHKDCAAITGIVGRNRDVITPGATEDLSKLAYWPQS